MKALIQFVWSWIGPGYLIPFIGRVITPCDEYGRTLEGVEADHAIYETGAFCIAWLGWYGMWAFGEVMPRAIDPLNPKQYVPGDVFQ